MDKFLRVSDSTYPQRSALGEHTSYSSLKSLAALADATAASWPDADLSEVYHTSEVILHCQRAAVRFTAAPCESSEKCIEVARRMQISLTIPYSISFI